MTRSLGLLSLVLAGCMTHPTTDPTEDPASLTFDQPPATGQETAASITWDTQGAPAPCPLGISGDCYDTTPAPFVIDALTCDGCTVTAEAPTDHGLYDGFAPLTVVASAPGTITVHAVVESNNQQFRLDIDTTAN